MAPLEDRSQVTVNTTAVEGATYEFMLDYMDQIYLKQLRKKLLNARDILCLSVAEVWAISEIMLKKPG